MRAGRKCSQSLWKVKEEAGREAVDLILGIYRPAIVDIDSDRRDDANS